MTVAELIAQLQDKQQDAEVLIVTDCHGCCDQAAGVEVYPSGQVVVTSRVE